MFQYLDNVQHTLYFITNDTLIKHIQYFFFPEYIDYHLSSESSITQTKTYPQILSRFDMKEDHPLNVTAQIASTITLHCVIRNLNNKTVRKYIIYSSTF